MLRNKRYKPNPAKENAPWLFREIDREILTYLAKYRFLRGRFIAPLLNRKQPAVNYSLHKMWERRLIDKPKSQFQGWNSLNDSDIYELMPKGEKKLLATVPEATNLLRVLSDTPSHLFAHSMMICDTLASIEIGVMKDGYRFITEAEITARLNVKDPLLLPFSIGWKFDNGHAENLKSHARPDAVFGLEYPDKRKRLLLLEAENYSPPYRNSFDRSSTWKKVLAYLSIRDTKAIKQLGRDNFNLLLAFPRQVELDAVKKRIEKHFGKSDLFLMKVVPVQTELLHAPSPFPELMFSGVWERAGMEPVSLKDLP